MATLPILDVVVARYKEDLQWLEALIEFATEYKLRVWIYNKSGDKDVLNTGTLTQFAEIYVQELPNIGRESHTYLFHIINRYDVNKKESGHEDITLFLQGNISDHVGCQRRHLHHFLRKKIATYVRARVDDAKINGASTSFAKAHDFGPEGSATYDFRIRCWRGDLEPAESAFGPWFEKYVQPEFPNPVYWWVAALFAIKTQRIGNRDCAYFSNLIAQLQTGNPEVGHYFERAWKYILNLSQKCMQNRV